VRRVRVKGQGSRVTGNTLLELLVVLAILGIVAGVAGLGFRTVAPPAPTEEAVARIAAARREAIRSGKSITISVARDGHVLAATAHPDGSVVADTALGIDRLSGRESQ
jgi:prepilin-type N-terminal cleavage/methylation domain-containing protein